MNLGRFFFLTAMMLEIPNTGFGVTIDLATYLKRDCARSLNPLQDARDDFVIAQSYLLESARALEKNNLKSGRDEATKAMALMEKGKGEMKRFQRELPSELKSEIDTFFKMVQKPAAKKSELARNAYQLQKDVDEFATTLTCPVRPERVVADLLPPEPKKSEFKNEKATFKVFAVSKAGPSQLVKEFTNVPFGNCPKCTRGISLNCRTPNSSSIGPMAAEACDAGLANGLGMRIATDKGKPILTIKNGTKYQIRVDGVPMPDGGFELANNKLTAVTLYLPAGADESKPTDVYVMELSVH